MQRYRTGLWWGLLLLTAGGLIALHAAARGRPPEVLEGAAPEQPERTEEEVRVGFRLMGQYAVGFHSLLSRAGWKRQAAQLIDNLQEEVESRAEEIRVAVVVGELVGADAAQKRLERIGEEALSPEQRADLEAIERLLGGAELAPEQRDRLVRRHGWFGRLALTHGAGDDDPERAAVLSRASRTAIVLVGATVGMFVVAIAGIVLFVLAIAAWRGGRLRFAYQPPPRAPGDVIWLQTVVLLMAGALAIAILPRFWRPAANYTYALLWVLAIIPCWPLLRGVGRREWREGVGLVRGRGILREMGAGIAGYLAGLPIVVAGILLTLFLSKVLSQSVSHPVFEEVEEGGVPTLVWVFLGACVWAPLVEEAVFRGAFYRYLRSRHSAIASAAAVGLLFAIIHPQGLAGTPAIMSLGFVFALIRQWRGSLIGSIFAHAVHNGTLLVLALLLFG